MKTIIDILGSHARISPDKIAVIMLGERGEEVGRLTYGALLAQVKAIASRLRRSHGVGERALMLFRPGLDFIVGFMACQHAGLTPVPAPLYTNRSHHWRRIEHICRDAGVSLVLTEPGLQSDIETWLEDSGLDAAPCRAFAASAMAMGEGGDASESSARPGRLAFLQYTSGSTGNPKGVMVTHQALMANCTLIAQKYGSSVATVTAGWLPFYHDMGLIGLILESLFLGSTLVLMTPVSFVKRPATWLKAISRYRVETSGGPNFGFQHCVERVRDEDIEGIDLSSWRVCFTGAEPVRQDTIDAFARRFAPYGFRKESFYPCYGLAEATLFVSGGRPGVAHATMTVDREAMESHRVISAEPGEPESCMLVSNGSVEGFDAAIVDPETRTRLPEGRVGEIWVHGASVASGYWGKSGETRETFQATLAGEGGRFYLRTGDLGFLARGELYVTGRLKDLVIVNGRNIYPQDVEQRIGSLDSRFAFGMAAVFAVRGAVTEEIVAVQEMDVRGGVSRSELRALSARIRREICESFDAPVAAVVLIPRGVIPRTTSGKIQRRKTREMWLKGTLSSLLDDSLSSAGQSELSAGIA